MFGRHKKWEKMFDGLCQAYYEKILGYCYAVLGDETAARDCTQEVFLVACQKSEQLAAHPNPGGFLFQTAKTLVKKTRRESFMRLMREQEVDEQIVGLVDAHADIANQLDKQIIAEDYVEAVLEQLPEDKLKLYTLYYMGKQTMAEIAQQLGMEEAALRMRYVRLRREMKAIVAKVCENNFDY